MRCLTAFPNDCLRFLRLVVKLCSWPFSSTLWSSLIFLVRLPERLASHHVVCCVGRVDDRLQSLLHNLPPLHNFHNLNNFQNLHNFHNLHNLQNTSSAGHTSTISRCNFKRHLLILRIFLNNSHEFPTPGCRPLVLGFVKNVDTWQEKIGEARGRVIQVISTQIFNSGSEFVLSIEIKIGTTRIWPDLICKKGSIGDTVQKEENLEFSFLPQVEVFWGSFFLHRQLHTVAMSVPSFLRYPGMLQGYVLLLGNFPSMRIPID